MNDYVSISYKGLTGLSAHPSQALNNYVYDEARVTDHKVSPTTNDTCQARCDTGNEKSIISNIMLL